MAGHVTIRRLEKPQTAKILLGGCTLWKWDEGDVNPQKLVFQADKYGYFLSARGENKSKGAHIWEFSLISDVRTGKIPKDKLLDNLVPLIKTEVRQEHCLMLVYRQDGITKLSTVNLIARTPELAKEFRKAVNELSHHLLDSHLSMTQTLSKYYHRIVLHADGHGRIMMKKLSKLLMVPRGSKEAIDYLCATPNTVLEAEDGASYIPVEKFTSEVFFNLVMNLNQNRGPDIDIIRDIMGVKASRQYIKLDEFQKFLNETQRDPRLNEILHPPMTREQTAAIMEKYGGSRDRLTSQGLLKYLSSEENNVLATTGIDQHMEMGRPLNYYFINSSHNTYLTGHQLRSESLPEMYAQVLLTGCRCVELDCWPRNDNEDIVITHGNTLCTKVSFRECVEAIAEYAFVASDYPVILSIENHCNRYPHLIDKMANVFIEVLGDKLLAQPLPEHPLEPAVRLPSPEQLRGKILIKDKVKRPKGELLNRDTAIFEEPLASAEPEKDGNGLPKTENDTDAKKEQQPAEATTDAKPTNSDVASGTNGSTNFLSAQNLPRPFSKKPSLGQISKGMTILEEPPDVDEKQAKEAQVPTMKLNVVSFDKGDSLDKNDSFDKGGGGSMDKGDESTSTDKSKSPDKGDNSDTSSVDQAEKTTDRDTASTEKRASVDKGDPQAATAEASTSPQNGTDNTDEETAKKKQKAADAEAKKRKYERGEALTSTTYISILNYATALSFESFETSEKLNCHYIMSSFGEEKGLTQIKTNPKDFVRYNLRQNSRVYPAGGRINSSNYMPQIYWNVGCQMAALNFQTPDMPLQLNMQRFEVNGGTGYLLKPSVMQMERGFNPFIQQKIQEIVPARLSIKVISGMFLTDKKTGLTVEAEMYGLPADTVRRQYTKKRGAAPHPQWEEDYFVFKRILLPDLASVRLAVIDDDHVLVCQRVLPVHLIRSGFRHISMRDKYSNPFGSSSLFVHIKIEDYVPDEMEEIVAALTDPIAFATRALQTLAAGTEDSDEEEDTDEPGKNGLPSNPAVPASPEKTAMTSNAKARFEERKASLPPELVTQESQFHSLKRMSGGKADALGLQPKGFSTLPRPSKGSGEDCLPCLLVAKTRPLIKAVGHDSPEIAENIEYLKILKAYTKKRGEMLKEYDKKQKALEAKQSKEVKKLQKASAEKVEEVRTQHSQQLQAMDTKKRQELHDFDKKSKTEQFQKIKSLMEAKHVQQRKLLEKNVNDDKEKVSKEIAAEMSRKQKTGEFAKNRDAIRYLNDQMVQRGTSTRSELSTVHDQQRRAFDESLTTAMENWEAARTRELEELEREPSPLCV